MTNKHIRETLDILSSYYVRLTDAENRLVERMKDVELNNLTRQSLEALYDDLTDVVDRLKLDMQDLEASYTPDEAIEAVYDAEIDSYNDYIYKQELLDDEDSVTDPYELWS